MSAEDDVFREFVELDNLPHWPCPACSKGVLLQAETGFSSHLCAASRAEQHNRAWQPDWDRRTFSLQLKCNLCEEVVFCTGELTYEPDYDNDGQLQYAKLLEPRYFHPSLSFVKLPPDMPQACRRAVDDSCRLLWASPAASANALRRAVELFLDNQGVQTTKPVVKGEKTWGRRLSLDERLQVFASDQKDKPWLSSLLQPIRIIGNAGSHEWSKEMRRSLVECFPLTQYVFEEFYDNRIARLARLKSIGEGIIARGGKLPPEV